jgi:hypothetical protein
MVRKSVRNLEKLVDAQPFGTLERVKDSTVLSAIEVVLDRSHPKIQAVAPPWRTFINVDLSIFLPDPPPESQTIDLEPGSASTTTERS